MKQKSVTKLSFQISTTKENICLAVLLMTLTLVASCGNTEIPFVLELEGDLSVHDPVIIRHEDTYYIFSTGGGRRSQGIIPIRRSQDLYTWTTCGYVFDKLPEWAPKYSVSHVGILSTHAPTGNGGHR